MLSGFEGLYINSVENVFGEKNYADINLEVTLDSKSTSMFCDLWYANSVENVFGEKPSACINLELTLASKSTSKFCELWTNFMLKDSN